jgi:uncharacterized repeat protein (TIGR01451 family)
VIFPIEITMKNFLSLSGSKLSGLLRAGFLFTAFILLGFNRSDSNQYLVDNKHKAIQDICYPPTFTLRSTDVTQANVNDAKIIISNIDNATRYAISENGPAGIDFSKSILINAGKREIEIKNIPNPATIKAYTVRVYNTENCYADQTVVLEHVNFANLADYSKLELVQGVDIHTPQLDEIVTFTTLIINKGNKTATNVIVQNILSSSLKVVYFYADKGVFESIGGSWGVGNVNGGETLKLIIKAKVTQPGLSYCTSYIFRQNGIEKDMKNPVANADESDYGVSCVSVPVSLKKDETYRVTLKRYSGVKWYYKNIASGLYEEITKNTSPNIAVINKDSSLSIAKGGEYTFSKASGTCNITSCCPILVEGCVGPKIVIDSIYCNKKVDSYSIRVKLDGDDWALVQQIYAATTNIGMPTSYDFLKRLNKLPLQSSAGYVVANGNGFYTVENVPAFMPNVSLTATDITGNCSTSKIVNAPNCNVAPVQIPLVLNQNETFSPGSAMPAFSVTNTSKGTEVLWFDNETSEKPIATGLEFTPKKGGTYYVAARDKKTRVVSERRELTMTEVHDSEEEMFSTKVCKCESATMKPDDDLSKVTISAIYPNPANNEVNFDYSLPENIPAAKLIFFNLSGTVVGTYTIENTDTRVKISTADWMDGTYVYQVLINGKRFVSNKFIVVH